MPFPRSSALVLSGVLAVVLSGCSSDEASDDAGPAGGTGGGGTSSGGTAGVSGSSAGGASSGAAGTMATGGAAGAAAGGAGPGGSAGSAGSTISDGHPRDSGIADDLELNAFWPQNYITDPGEGSVWYDDMVVARRRIGCLR